MVEGLGSLIPKTTEILDPRGFAQVIGVAKYMEFAIRVSGIEHGK